MPKNTKILQEPEITDEKRDAAEDEIREKRKVVDYDTKEYPVEVLVQKYRKGLDEDINELYIPDYQRAIVWTDEHQSKFIESILLGLPIPYIFVADLRSEKDDEEDLGRLEIIDGTQRIRTLDKFLNNQLRLGGLEKLEKLNNFKYQDLSLARQRRFNRATIRMIVLTEKSYEEVRRDMFERINTGSIALNEMEIRRGISPGPFVDLLEELSREPKFRQLCPFSKASVRSREPEEFVLRFFAYLDNYKKFDRQVNVFLNEYLESHNNSKINKDTFRDRFHTMLDFVDKYFPNGFSKSKGHVRTPRIRFEAISVGVSLLLLYSLVESSMRNAIEAIFDELETKKISYNSVRIEIKNVVLHNFKNCSPDKIQAKIKDISLDIIKAGFDRKEIFSGNIDRKEVTKTARKYGFSFDTNYSQTKHGEKLEEVMRNRNDLAHGNKSFAEVGREISIEELLEIKEEIIEYLSQILNNIEQYLIAQEYLDTSLRNTS